MKWWALLPLVALVGFGGLGLIQLFDGTKPDFERVSRAAPVTDFPLFETPGSRTSFPALAEEAGAPIIVNLWATWCPPCVAEHPLLMELGARYPGRVHGVLYDDTVANAQDFLAQRGNPFTTMALDPSGQLGLDFGLTGVPETFVIDGGSIVLHLRGQLLPEHFDVLDEVMTAPDARLED